MSWGSTGVIKASIVWRYNASDDVVNVWHIGYSDKPSDQADFYTDIAEFLSDMYASVTADMSDLVIHNRIELYNQGTNSPEAWIGSSSEFNGTNTNDPVPTGVSALIYCRTSTSRCIGKKYLPPFTEEQTLDGVWNATTIGHLNTMAAKWGEVFVASNGTTLRAGIWRKLANAITYPISNQSSSIPAYQRRRRIGRGS